MLKQISLFLIGLITTVGVRAQQPPDYEQIKKMTPAQLEVYKQKVIKEATEKALSMADKNNLSIPASQLPGATIKPPVKDVQRLNLLPVQPPTRAALVNSLQQSAQQIQKGIPAPKIQEIQQAVTTLSVEAINEKAIMSFYGWRLGRSLGP